LAGLVKYAQKQARVVRMVAEMEGMRQRDESYFPVDPCSN